MSKLLNKNILRILFFMHFVTAIVYCNPKNKSETNVRSTEILKKVSIPDTVIQFLISSASSDFRDHQPRGPLEFRNVRIGYINSDDNEKTYVLCGDFLTEENSQWIEFTTIKTSGYEQYLGKTQYCQDATIVLTDEAFSSELKKRFEEK